MHNRRSYLKLAGSTAAVIGSTGCAGVDYDSITDRDRTSDEGKSIPANSQRDESGERDDVQTDTVERRIDVDGIDSLNGIDIDYDQYREPSDVYRVWTGDPESFSFVNDRSFTGDTSMQCVIENSGSNGANAAYWFPENGYEQPYEVYQRVLIYLGDEWTMEEGDVCRFWSSGLNTEAGQYGSGGRGYPLGDDGWSAMLAVTNREAEEGEYNLASYIYHIDQPGNSGEFEVVDAPIVPGEWFELESYVWMNSVSDGRANSDGELRYWFNGDLVYERTDLRWTVIEEQAIEYAGAMVRYGGGETAPTDLYIYYDAHQIAVCETPVSENVDTSCFDETSPLDQYGLAASDGHNTT